ncbi:MAG: hypothetical protein IJO04_02560 [Oscillospiraceae bacterium]|nr:hypothetical protein [Oscillospiraceae bacterium]
MKRSRKSLVALLLVLCMAMSFVVPATFAATEKIVFDFGNPDATGQYTVTAATKPASPILLRGNATGANAPTNDAYLLNCNSGRGFEIGNSIITFRANATKYWSAIKLCDIKAGTYDLSLSMQMNTSGSGDSIVYAQSNVYIMSYADYAAAFASTNMASVLEVTSATQNTGNEDLRLAITDAGKENASFSIKRTADSGDGSTAQKLSMTFDKEGINFPADGDYVLMFRTTTKAAFAASGLSLTREVADPAVAKIGDTAYPTLAAALEAAASGDEIKLVDNVADAGSFTVPSGVTLDLNGKNLTADNINVAGTLKDSASAGVLTANITCTNGNRGWLPLTNGSGKTLFELKAASLGVAEKTEDTAKFGFNVHFVNAAAYAKAGNTTIKVLMTWDGGSASATASETFVSSWASTNSGNGKAIGVTVNGLTGVANFKLQPVVEVNGVTVNLDAIALS